MSGPSGPAASLVVPRPARIVHVTDIHVGREFNETVWTAFKNACIQLAPDILVVTGDLVDTPFRWRLRKASELLRSVTRDGSPAQSTADSSPETTPAACRLMVVPGNHDTRLTGLVPLLSWRALLVLDALAIPACCTARPAASCSSEVRLGSGLPY